MLGATDLAGIAQLVTAVGVSVVGFLGVWLKRDTRKLKEETSAVNDAVNRVHPGTPRLFDLVAQASDHAKQNKEDIDTLMEISSESAVALDGVRGCIDGLRRGQDTIDEKLNGHITRLDEHIAESGATRRLLEERIEEVRAREQGGEVM